MELLFNLFLFSSVVYSQPAWKFLHVLLGQLNQSFDFQTLRLVLIEKRYVLAHDFLVRFLRKDMILEVVHVHVFSHELEVFLVKENLQL